MGFFNVRDEGAKGDGHTNDRPAIQRAIDAAAAADRGGVVFFPPGEYVVDGGSLRLPPVPGDQEFGLPRVIILRGVGWRISAVVNRNAEATGPSYTPLIAPGDIAGGGGVRGYVFEDLELGGGSATQEVFRWDPDVVDIDSGRYRIEAFFHRVMFTARNNLIGPDTYLVRLHGASRTRFLNCLFTRVGFDIAAPRSLLAANYEGGAAVRLYLCGGVTLTDCHTLEAGAMLDVERSGEVLVSNSRSEGGMGRPAWRFVRSHNITLVNPANEGRAERPAIFEFDDCRDVVIINPQFATPNVPVTGEVELVDAIPDAPPPGYVHAEAPQGFYAVPAGSYADVVRITGCENVRIIGGHLGRSKVAPAISAYGDGTARLVRVVDSRNVTGENIPSLATPDPRVDFSISASSTDCHLEAWAQHTDQERRVTVT